MIYFKNRSLKLNTRVEVYRNLHARSEDEKYSIRHKRSGLVVAHSHTIYLNKVLFKVRQKGREKVIAEKKKNVHAFVRGFCVIPENHSHVCTERITYDPYKNKEFIDSSGRPVESAEKVMMNSSGVWAYNVVLFKETLIEKASRYLKKFSLTGYKPVIN